MTDPKVTFFMVVTDPDLIIADYTVRSYGKIHGIPFKLRIYSNWISNDKKRQYFPSWQKLEFVEIIENEWQLDENKPSDRHLEGPFEKVTTIFDRELKKIQSPYYATVDADFEILDATFVQVMLDLLDTNTNLAAISTDYEPARQAFERYSGEVVWFNERWATFFCIYKIETLRCKTSHLYYEEIIPETKCRSIWDGCAYFQKNLKDNFDYELQALDSKYQPCFIHYGGFGRNREINHSNIGLYRFFRIVHKCGIFRIKNKVTCKLGYLGEKIFFGRIDWSHYWPGWGIK
jgi:hypothetical protein